MAKKMLLLRLEYSFLQSCVKRNTSIAMAAFLKSPAYPYTQVRVAPVDAGFAGVLSPEVQAEYDRWICIVGTDDPYAGPTTLGIHEVLRAHFLIADFFLAEGEGIGGFGPRDANLLHSALYRQHVTIGGQLKWKDKFEICATLMYGLIMDHPFHDANKRTAFLSTLHYLYKHGRTPTVSHRDFEDFTVDVAEHKLDKYVRYREYQKDGKGEPECRFISHYLRSKTRELDKRTYFVTYRDLKRILNSFGYDLENESGNYIDVVRVSEERAGFLFRTTKIVRKKVAQIGFPGWTKQVRAGAIDTVRKETGLTAERGVDSQAFFNGVEPLQKLIAHYEEPLRRLANR